MPCTQSSTNRAGHPWDKPGHDKNRCSARPLAATPRMLYNHSMSDTAYSDPLDWRGVRAPALEEIEVIGGETSRPEGVWAKRGPEPDSALLGLSRGAALPFRHDSAPVQMP